MKNEKEILPFYVICWLRIPEKPSIFRTRQFLNFSKFMFSLYSFNILTACIFYIKFLFFRILLGNNAVDITFFCIKLISVLTVPVKRDIPHNMETSACSHKKKEKKRKKKKVMCGSGRWEWLKEMWWLKYMMMAQRDVVAQW